MEIPLGLSAKNASFSYMEKASFSCLPGYSLVQNSSLVCALDGQWLGEYPLCVPSLCGGPSTIRNGTLLIASWSEQPLTDKALALVKASILRRKKSGAEILLKNVDNSIIRINSTETGAVFYPVGSEIWFDCLPGYQLKGSTINKCYNTDQWENPFPVCQEVICPELLSIQNGKISIEGFRFNRHAIHSCNEGYFLSGQTVRRCLDNGTWSEKPPECVPKLCNDPSLIRHGRLLNFSSLDYGSVVTYACEDGYKLIGGAERVCGHAGKWSGQPPLCVNNTETCLVPQLISSGYVAFDGNLEVGSRAWYDCSDEYELIGNSERVCINDGSWSGDDPLCQPKLCAAILNLKNGKVKGKMFDFGSSLQFSCNPGFTLKGKNSITCSDKGIWSDKLPVCVPTKCPSPLPLANGKVRGSAHRYGDSILNECNTGYTLIGPRVRKCNLNGEWSGSSPHCASIICPEITDINNGFTTFHLRVPGEKARFGCNVGWKIDGPNNITCTSNGTWEIDLPKCIRNTCTLSLEDTNATLLSAKKDNYEIYDIIEWKCSANLKAKGNKHTKCLPNGEWSDKFPTCHVPECKDMFSLENGVIFGTKNTTKSLEVRFSCDNGYYKIMDSFLECKVDGKWRGNVPICSKKVCKNEFQEDHALVSFKPESSTYSAEFKCNQQYELDGQPKLTCINDNTWSAAQPKCNLKYCKSPYNIPNMIPIGDKVHIGKTVKFECRTGYLLKGQEFLKCLESGEWEQIFPICIPKTCEISHRLKHGAWIIKHSSHKKMLWSNGTILHENTQNSSKFPSVYVDDKLSVVCDHGFDVHGEISLVCLPNQRMSARFPKCKPKHCRKLPNIENGAVIHNGTYRGAIVNYRCDRGFRLTGTNSRVCRRNKNWSRSPPVCTPIKCVKPHNIAHGEVDYNPDDLQFGSKVKFYCHLGYELTGMNERVCGEDGSWIGEEPECVLIRCPPPKIPLHGEQEIHDLSVGGSISYNCNHGYKLVGPRVLTCLNNKTWTGKNPMCKKIICELPKNITNGYVKYSDMHYQASVDYTCEDGYNLVGLRTRSCLHSGRWNGKEPQCVPHFCNPVGKLFLKGLPFEE